MPGVAGRRLAVSAVVIVPGKGVLLVRQAKKRRGYWELPGGHVRKRESILDALTREVWEETSLRVTPEQLVGVFDIPGQRYADVVIRCRSKRGRREPKPRTEEVEACGFYPIDDLPRAMRPYTRARIRDGVRRVEHSLPVVLGRGQWVD